ncbi:MAG TPA: PocR ligand-binding domain-containing protein, partial [Blastocatellia bacterium]|nr:PocR ligand-binding domain-containing protein [Blastocatellia bacterium]
MMVDVANISERESEPEAQEPSLHRLSASSPRWLAAQQTLAASSNLALVTVDVEGRWPQTSANETSICQSFLADPAKAQMCAEFCGKAPQRALAAGHAITFRCEANLHCFAAPLQRPGESTPLVVIGGRTFLSVSEYREFLQRETSGGRRPDPKLFSNLKFTDAEEFARHQQMILTTASEVLSHDFSGAAADAEVAATEVESRVHTTLLPDPSALLSSDQ